MGRLDGYKINGYICNDLTIDSLAEEGKPCQIM